jgi:hypothetical protein
VKSRSLCRLLVKAGQWPRACPGGISLCPSAAGGVAFVERRLDFCTRAGWWDRVSSSKIQERRETLRESERIRDRKRSSNTQLAKWLDYYVIFFYNIFRDLSRADPNPTSNDDEGKPMNGGSWVRLYRRASSDNAFLWDLIF